MKSVIKGLGLSDVHRDKESPVVKANPFSKLTLWWINHHVWQGFRRPLAPHDIYTVPPSDKSVRGALNLGRYWDDLPREKQKKKHALLRASLKSNWKTLFTAMLFVLLGEVCNFAQPFLVGEITGYFKGKGVTKEWAWGYAGVMVFLTILYSIFSAQGEFLGQVVAMRMRASCTAMLTRKATRLSSKGLSELSPGMILNLLASDMEKFYNAASEFKGLFVGPIVLVALLILMAINLRQYIIPAVAFVILWNIIRFGIGNISFRSRLRWAESTDARISTLSEVVNSMSLIKGECWEHLVEKKLKALRSQEIKGAGITMFLNGLNLNLGYICDRVVTFLIILTMVFYGETVDYKTSIQVLTWMKMGQLGFLNFPIGYSMWKQMEASLSRIQEFLTGDEIGLSKLYKESKCGKNEAPCVSLQKASASWTVQRKNESELEKMMKATLLKSIGAMTSMASAGDTFVPSGTFSLRNVSLHVESGMRVALIGRTGSGKTSLLLAILGGLPLGGGKRTVKGQIAYVPQSPWIRADTIRNNILMGEKMYRSKYNAVLQACALQKDIAMMPDGDMTMIGERGSTISGGQRARISLARAVYRDSDIYIMDDPSSALDNKITNHVFNECFKGLLKDKIVIMATNDISLLHDIDHVVAMSEGRVAAQGPLDVVAKKMKVNDFLAEPIDNIMNTDEIADVFLKQDKQSMLMSLLSNQHIKKEHAHVPKKRATPLSVYMQYWLAGRGYITMILFALLLLLQQVFSIVGEWWLVYNISVDYKKGKGNYSKDDKYGGGTSNKYGESGNSGYGYKSTTDAYRSTTSSPLTVMYDMTQGILSSSAVHDATSTMMSAMNPAITMQPTFMVRDANDTVINLAAATPDNTADKDQRFMLWLYGTSVGLCLTIGIFAVIAGTSFTILAAKNLYNTMFGKIMFAPIAIFRGDKAGEMVNRFARDTGRMDDIIPITINYTFLTAAIIISQTVYICIINYWVVVASIPFFALVILLILYSIRAIRDTKRLESEFRTPTFESLQHLMDGLEVIRAFGMEGFMIKEGDALLDRHTSAWHLYIGSMYWMKMRVNFLVTLYLAGVLILGFSTHTDASLSSPIGLSLSYILVFMSRVRYCAMYSAMLDANMTSVEHICEYDHVEHEDRLDTEFPVRLILPPAWPEYGVIKFNHVSIMYPGTKAHLLSNLTFTIKGGEKVGIVGRSGAGKSTIFNIIMRLYDFTGRVTIDECNIKAMGLHELRDASTYLCQDAILHTGTLRQNLDPFNKYTDRHIWLALEKVKLKTKVIQLPGQLNTQIEAEGSNFSAGQKQLLCMVRALLNDRKIMLLDEITADVDIETARLLDKVLGEQFKDCTVLSISHDLERIIHYDKILVMDEGAMVQFDHPYILLQDVKGPFYALVRQLGNQRLSQLSAVAEKNYKASGLPLMTRQTRF